MPAVAILPAFRRFCQSLASRSPVARQSLASRSPVARQSLASRSPVARHISAIFASLKNFRILFDYRFSDGSIELSAETTNETQIRK
jgi:hypothetical protein